MCMCLSWLILSLWLILAVSQEENCECPQNMFQLCELKEVACWYWRNDDGIMKLNESICLHTDNPTFSDDRLPLKISCTVNQESDLYFSLDTSDPPESVQYSICYRLSHEVETPEHTNNTIIHVGGPVYQTLIPKKTSDIILQLNVSYPDHWFIQHQVWEICTVEKPDPPEITNATIQSDNLYLEWNLPKSIETNPTCFQYELRINDEVIPLEEKQSYTMPNVDPTQTYRIQMRAKNAHCCESLYWSNWTSVLDVGLPATVLTDLHIGVIIAIALGLPMILLAILLLCKFQRVFDKLFPPIPGPSIKIKGQLEKDETSQIMSHKCVEEVTEVEVKEYEPEEKEEEN